MPRTFTIPTRFTAIDKMSDVLKQMGNSVRGFGSTVQAVTARSDRMFRALGAPIRAIQNALGNVGIYLGGYLVFRTIRNMIKVFADFEQANADLAAVMGITVQQNRMLALDAQRLSLSTPKSATEIAQLQIELAKLGFGMSQIHNMQGAIITGSIALDASIDRTASLVGHITQQFNQFNKDGSDSQRIVDILTKAANDSSLKFSDFETALRQSGPSANALGIKFEKLAALLTVLSNSGIDASSSGTALRNIFIDSSAKGHTFEQVLQNIVRHHRSLVAAKDIFGRRTAVSATILAKNLTNINLEYERLTENNLKLGYTNEIANKKLDTFSGSVIKLKNSYDAFILSIEDGTGKLAPFLRMITAVGRGVLLLANGNENAMTEFNKLDAKTKAYSKTVLSFLGILKLAAIALGVVYTITVAMKFAMTALAFATQLVKIATWAWNAALAANPIGLIVIGVLAVITAITIVVKKWNEWGAAVSLFMGPLGFIVNLVKTFSDHWGRITKAFESGGIKKGILEIGKALADVIIKPIQQLFALTYRLTGINKFNDAAKAYENINKLIQGNTVIKPVAGTSVQGRQDVYNPSALQQESIERRMETQKQQVTMTINNKSGHDVDIDSAGKELVPIKVTSTWNGWGVE